MAGPFAGLGAERMDDGVVSPWLLVGRHIACVVARGLIVVWRRDPYPCSADIPDFEDAVQFFSAIHAQADCIITRNVRDFPGETIPATITTMQGNVTSILADTNELQTEWAEDGRLDLLLDEVVSTKNVVFSDKIVRMT